MLITRNSLYFLFATAFGLGLLPLIPGTFAALLGVLLHCAIALVSPPVYHFWLLLLAFSLASFACLYLNDWAEAYWGEKDSKHFVLDEVAGYLLTVLLFSSGLWWKRIIWALLLFRLMDVTKLGPPARYIDKRRSGAWAVLFDDLVSACYAAAILQLMFHYCPNLLL